MGTWDKLYEENYNIITNPEEGFEGYITNTEEYGWLCSAGAAIMDEEGEVIAYAMVDLSMDEVMNERYTFLGNLSFVMLGITLILLIVFLLIINKSIIIPINKLSVTARNFVEIMSNDSNTKELLFSKFTIKSGDEIENLHKSFQFMEKEIYEYIDNLERVTSEKERIAAELSIAKKYRQICFQVYSLLFLNVKRLIYMLQCIRLKKLVEISMTFS